MIKGRKWADRKSGWLRKPVFWISIGVLIAVLVSLFAPMLSNSWKFAVLCDTRNDDNNTHNNKSGINDQIIKNLSNEIVKENCDLVLVPGDMINGWLDNRAVISAPYAYYRHQFHNWTMAMDPVYKKNIRIYAVRGNHEDGPVNFSQKEQHEVAPYNTYPDSKLINAFIETFGFNKQLQIGNPINGPAGEVNLTYSFTHKNAFFIGLDEYTKPHRVNQKWLDDQLKMNTKPFVFVFGHEPAFQISHPDCLAYYSANRSQFWNSIGRAGCQIYFCGHDHLYDRAHIRDSSDNIIYQMVVSSGAPNKGWKPPYSDDSVIGDFHSNNSSGYVLVTIQDNDALVEWKAFNSRDTNWTTQDRFYLKGKESKGILWAERILYALLIICLIGLIYIAQNENRWANFEKTFWNGEACGEYDRHITAIIILIAIPGVIAACWLFIPMYHEEGMIPAQGARNVVQGVSLFAAVYLVTQMIERIIEFFSNIPIFKDTNKMAKLQKKIDQRDLGIKEYLKANPAADIANEEKYLDELMDKQNCLESPRKSRLLAAATGLGIIFSYFFVGLFALVGITAIPHWIDVLITGIILGGGSKPLHDLITNIEKRAQ
jgi:hypothetical protein